MKRHDQSEKLHRLAKQLLDSGEADSIEAANAVLQGYQLTIDICEHEARDRNSQIALLTSVTLAQRVFLGGVAVHGALDVPLQVDIPLGETLEAAVLALGGRVNPKETWKGPLVSIGGHAQPRRADFHIRTVNFGWRGGVVPADSDAPLAPDAIPIAAMLSAALAISEAFFYVRGENQASGHRAVGLSLWQPGSDKDWLAGSVDEPTLQYLPSRLWLIGLGHLGQAYLWAIGLLPYPEPRLVQLLLQDFDVVTPSTESTSILTSAEMVGQRKSRVMAAWAERRGFSTTICERRFDDATRRHESEPGVALCGLDNALGRRSLDKAGFPFVVEVGLGSGYRDFRTIRLHTLPARRPSTEIWRALEPTRVPTDKIAYRKMIEQGVQDQCGATLLAGKAVGAPFVGSIAACLAVSEVLRLLHGGVLSQLVDLDLQAIEHRTVVERRDRLRGINPGYVVASDVALGYRSRGAL